ncbi:MAG: SDR family oxidoreductase [Lachnospiraceae bacterium]|nr:SDR family oxidoreductase [Lachnospiraceae bacterium]
MKLLENKNAIITGAAGGIGKSTVECFAENGANIWACELRSNESFEKDMKEISEKYGVWIETVYFDVTDEEQVKTAVKQIRSKKVSVDVLANVAGIVAPSTSFVMTDMSKIKKVFEVNFFALTLLTQYVSRLMIRQNSGSIVNIASIAGIDGDPAQYEYAASKAAVIGGTKKLARELAPNNIRVNAIAPGMIQTEMGTHIEDDLRDEILAKVMMKRMGRPEEIANAIAFVASDMASYMTGQVLRVDGGI